MDNLKEYELKLILQLTLELVVLKQKECRHLSVEEAAPEILNNLMEVMHNHRAIL
ncbi:MAG: hypothetical protein MJK15_04080 [Colwellia sp.]|nr:hypothetical protein [Colwellia sp.]